MPGWLFVFPLLGHALTLAADAGKAWPRRWAITSTAILVIVGGGRWPFTTRPPRRLGAAFPKLFKRGDPTAESIEWTAVRTELARRRELGSPAPMIRRSPRNGTRPARWTTSVGDEADCGGLLPRSRGSSACAARRAGVGRDALIIGRLENLKRRLPQLQGYFQSVSWAAPIAVGRQGRPEILIGVVEAHDLLRPYPRPAFGQP